MNRLISLPQLIWPKEDGVGNFCTWLKFEKSGRPEVQSQVESYQRLKK